MPVAPVADRRRARTTVRPATQSRPDSLAFSPQTSPSSLECQPSKDVDLRPTWRAFWRETVPSRSLTAPLIAVTAVCGLLDASTLAYVGGRLLFLILLISKS